MIKVKYLVVGAGPAGIAASTTLAKESNDILVVSKQLGGAYCNDGVVVSNSLLYFSQMYTRYLQVHNNFIDNGKIPPSKLDFKRLKKYIDNNVNKAKRLILDKFEKYEITYISGTIKFIEPHKAELTREDGEIDIVVFEKALIAVGSDQQKLLSNLKLADINSVSKLETIPTSISIIGGGLIGVELACVFNRLGTKVNIVEKGETILSFIDSKAAKRYEDILKKKGINIIHGREVISIDKVGQKYLILFNDMQIESEQVFLSIGRKPFISPLNLEAAGVNINEDGNVIFDTNFTTDNKDIYVAGDVTAIGMRLGWAVNSGETAAQNMLGKDILSDEFAFTTYLSTDPELGFIGLSEEQARKTGYDYDVIKVNHTSFYNHLLVEESPTTIKIVYNKADNSFLGVYVLGSGVREILSVFNMFFQNKIKVDNIATFTGIRPVYNDIFCEIASKVKKLPD